MKNEKRITVNGERRTEKATMKSKPAWKLKKQKLHRKQSAQSFPLRHSRNKNKEKTIKTQIISVGGELYI